MSPNTVLSSAAPIELWRHANPGGTQMFKFLQHVNSKYGLTLSEYPALYQWSIDNVAAFWEETWHFVRIVASKPYNQVLPSDAPIFPRPDFFSGARLNFAENLLFSPNSTITDTDVAVITATELDPDGVSTTWGELREAVRRCSNQLRAAGVKPNDVVAGYLSNHVQALVAMLSSATIGALWTGLGAEMGVSAVLDRLVQIGPKVLVCENGAFYNGKEWPAMDKNVQIVDTLKEHGLTTVIVVENLKGADLGLDLLKSDMKIVGEYEDFLRSSPTSALLFEQLPPSHPLYILYSSGTTGLPKAIIHTAIGTLIQHKKEHFLHCSLSSSSRHFYFTSLSWMMHHWLVSSLAVGASLVLYSGSPFKPYGYKSMLKLISSLRVTHFGTSAAYLTTLESNNVLPSEDPTIDLLCLEAIYSTASPLPPSTFSYVYSAFPPTVNLASITGGTDIVSLFGCPCPLLPVRPGEIQCTGLGMAVSVVDSASEGSEPQFVSPAGAAGDLVCLKPFPCQPLTFYGADGDAKYYAAYFERFGGRCWHHGDFVRMDPKSTALVMLGRSDGVLKPAGVRFGSAEIYNTLTKFFAAEVEDAICAGRRREMDIDETVCLFVVMVEGKTFDDGVRGRIKDVVRKQLSPRHVPGVVELCGGGIPKTANGKKLEVAVKKILCGIEVKTNASVANPEALDWFRDWAKNHA